VFDISVPSSPWSSGTLDEYGCPVWIADLADTDPNHLVHVVRDLAPADALELLGADRQSIRPGELPAERPDEWTSLPRAAVTPLDPDSVLVAGRAGAWTFVYDDAGRTIALWHLPDRPPLGATEMLSIKGNVAATSNTDIDGHTGFTYAVDGRTLVWADGPLGTRQCDGNTPSELRAAVEAAEISNHEDDHGVNMRTICALAGLPSTSAELRRIPLLIAPLDQNRGW
jgi:hypothetical protein